MGERETLEPKMASTFQAWVTSKMVATLTGISKSAGRAGGMGGDNEFPFGFVKFEISLSHLRKDVRQAESSAVPVNKYK